MPGAPTEESYHATRHEELMQTRWSSGSLETPADLERTFQLLEAHLGGDGQPIVFEPYYIVGSPDYDAIRASEFRYYVDVGLDQGVSQGWERGDIVAKAREGIERGVWSPQYHGRTHHFSHHRWLKRLREGEPRAVRMFAHRMYVCENVRERVPEHEDMAEPERKEWVRGAMGYFIRSFGFAPTSVRNSDEAEIAWATQGIEIRVGASDREGEDQTGKRSPLADLWYSGSAINFEPFQTADQETFSPASKQRRSLPGRPIDRHSSVAIDATSPHSLLTWTTTSQYGIPTSLGWERSILHTSS